MGKRILIADDSVTIQRAFAMVFATQDVTLAAARSLDEAVANAKQTKPDLVIADAALAGRTGYDLCTALKADAGLRSVPVYILASTHVAYDEAKGRQAGAAGSLTKPFDSQVMIDKVNEALAKAGPVPASAGASRPSTSMPVATSAPTPVGGSAVPQPVAARADLTSKIDDVDFDEEDSYGEFTIERTESSAPPVGPQAAPARPSTSMPAAPRPSLIPGVSPATASRPPAVPPALRTPSPTQRPPAPLPASPAPEPAPPAASRPTMSRTIMGMPAMQAAQVAAAIAAKGSPSGPAPSAPVPSSPSAPTTPGRGQPPITAPGAGAFDAKVEARAEPKPDSRPRPLEAKVESVVEQKLAAVAARGPEYEAIARLSREIIEQVVWEVVPELAEAIIRENLDRLAANR